MGIDAPGGPIHLSLGAHAQGLELRQDLPGRSLRVGQSPPGAGAEVSPQGAGTVQKGEEIHVPVGAAVVPVHQSRLGRDRDLVEQGPLGGRADASGLAGDVPVQQQPVCVRLQLLHAVGAAAGAQGGGLGTQEATPPLLPHVPPAHLGPVGPQHVDVPQAAGPALILQSGHPDLDQLRRLVHREKGGLSGGAVGHPLIQDRAQGGEHVRRLPSPLLEQGIRQEMPLHRPGHVQAQANQAGAAALR